MKKKPNFFDDTPQGRWDKIEDIYKQQNERRTYHFKPLKRKKRKKK